MRSSRLDQLACRRFDRHDATCFADVRPWIVQVLFLMLDHVPIELLSGFCQEEHRVRQGSNIAALYFAVVQEVQCLSIK